MSTTENTDFFADVQKEGTSLEEAFKDKETDTPSESQPENEPEEEEPAGGDDTQPEPDVTPSDEDEDSPFHKRWRQREEKLRDDLRKEFETELEAVKSSLQAAPSDTETEIPETFKLLYGDNPVAYEAWREEIRREAQAIVESREYQQAEASRKEAEEAEYWNNWTVKQLDELEAAHGEFDRKKFGEFMLKVKPTDEDNNLDFKTGFELFQQISAPKTDPARSQARKQIADSVTAPSKGEPTKKDYMTPDDLRGKSWNSL